MENTDSMLKILPICRDAEPEGWIWFSNLWTLKERLQVVWKHAQKKYSSVSEKRDAFEYDTSSFTNIMASSKAVIKVLDKVDNLACIEW